MQLDRAAVIGCFLCICLAPITSTASPSPVPSTTPQPPLIDLQRLTITSVVLNTGNSKYLTGTIDTKSFLVKNPFSKRELQFHKNINEKWETYDKVHHNKPNRIPALYIPICNGYSYKSGQSLGVFDVDPTQIRLLRNVASELDEKGKLTVTKQFLYALHFLRVSSLFHGNIRSGVLAVVMPANDREIKAQLLDLSDMTLLAFRDSLVKVGRFFIPKRYSPPETSQKFWDHRFLDKAEYQPNKADVYSLGKALEEVFGLTTGTRAGDHNEQELGPHNQLQKLLSKMTEKDWKKRPHARELIELMQTQ